MTEADTKENTGDGFWAVLSDKLRRSRHLHALTPDEAASEFCASPDVSVSDSEVEAIVERVVSEQYSVRDTPDIRTSWIDPINSWAGQAALTDGIVDDNDPVDQGITPGEPPEAEKQGDIPQDCPESE